MDSTSLLLHLLARDCHVFGISFDYGQKHRLELERLQANLKYLGQNGFEISWDLIDVSGIGKIFRSALLNEDWDVPLGHYELEQMKQTVVPNRNAIFSAIAYGYALSISQKESHEVDVCLGVHSGDHAIYPDCRPEFYAAIYEAFAIGNWESDQIGLYLPYLEFEKYDILKDAQESVSKLDLDFQTIFTNTLTSYQPTDDGLSHGMTGSDVERILAFHKLGIPDPLDYKKPWEQVLETALEFQRENKNIK